MPPKVKVEFVNKTDFPPYAIACLADRYIIVGGGGGIAKTGIKNKFVVYQLFHNGHQTTSRQVLSFDVGDYCISNLTAWLVQTPVSDDIRNCNKPPKGSRGYTTDCPTIMLAIGKEESCMILKLSPKLVSDELLMEEDISNKAQANENGVRRRHQSVEEIHLKNGLRQGLTDKISHSGKLLPDNCYYSFDVESICSFTTIFRTEMPRSSSGLSGTEDLYQKTVRVSRNCDRLVTAGTDGAVRVWQLPGHWKGDIPNQSKRQSDISSEPVLLRTIHAHTGAVDQVDLHPYLDQVVSLCKTTRECCVWDYSSGKKVIQLALHTPEQKYKFAWARYGVVEADNSLSCKPQSRLFTVSNPVVGSKKPGIVSSWCGKQYSQQRQTTVPGVLSNLAVSDDGRYLATGTMDGDVIIMIAFSLQVLQRIPDAHSMFVTGIEFMPGRTRSSCVVRGFSETSILSVSCDNTLLISHVPAVTMLPVWVVAVLSVLVLTATFLLASYLGL